MQVTTITTPAEEIKPHKHILTEEQLKGNLDYYRAEKITNQMLEKGLISNEQYGLIMTENRRVFKPFLSELF